VAVFARVLGPWRRSSTWWTLTHLTTDVVVGLVACSVVLALLVSSVVLLITFFLALPVIWLLFVASRGFARLERSRCAALLGLQLADPVPPLRAGSWWRRLLERVRTPARWKEIAYLLVLLPLGIFTFFTVFAVWCGALALVALPAYVSRLPEETAKFGWFDAGAGGAAFAVAAVGVLVLLVVAPWTTVALGRLDAATVRWFLGPDARAAQEARIRRAETGRVAAVDSAESERRRIERDLHDGAQARLVSLALDLGTARDQFDSDPDAARALVAHAHDEAKAALRELRDLVRGIHPVILEDRGLDAALSAVVARAPLPVALEVDVEPRPPAIVESTAYFVVSEALANVARHSEATNAAVSVVCDGDSMIVEIRDNGTGAADETTGSGLVGLRDRVAAVDGTLEVTSPAGGPTLVRVVLPCA
jgi:signal transduction histidine kinase